MGAWLIWLGMSLVAFGPPSGEVASPTGSFPACTAAWGSDGSARAEAVGSMTTRLGRDASGALRLEGRVGDLRFEHQVRQGGRLELRLLRTGDEVGVNADLESMVVKRNGSQVRLAIDDVKERDLLAVQRLLAGSTAVFRFRRAAAALSLDRRRSVEGAAVLMADALLGTLGGDPQSVARLVDGLRTNRPAVRLVSIEDDKSCYERWEAQAIRTWDDYKLCLIEAWALRDLCALRFYLAAEANWFEMLGCIAFPLKVT